MMKKITAICIILALTMCFAAWGETKETTLTGMVVSVDGTTISLMEMSGDMADMGNRGNQDASRGERPQMPEGMEGFGNFDPESFGGQMPEGFDPESFGGQIPEGFDPESFGGQMPEGFDPESFGGQMPEGGRDFGNFEYDGETKTVDISSAHISVEIDGGKASGSMEDIQPGSFVTITMNGKGQVTNVLVTQSGFGGGNFGNFGGFGNFGDFGGQFPADT